ncbi:TIGR03986 family CRISPR-associated RAMP protein [Serratia sp. S1B]|nr:TIGR03986 family CRISPR-associated RAMP protein [Serratia sp. S1B]
MSKQNETHGPYHFVPLSRWIYMPAWAHQVSHDVPFRQGYSGKIVYRLHNKTPLLVGAEQYQPATDQPTVVKWARDPAGRLIIPGSSLKGMLRTVLEIVSFGKFATIDDQRFSYRDLSHAKNSYLLEYNKHTVCAGWLKYHAESQKWKIRYCKFVKIKHADLNDYFGKNAEGGLKNSLPAPRKYQLFPLKRDLLININSEVEEKEGNKEERVDYACDIGSGITQSQVVFLNKRIKGKGEEEDYNFSYCFYDIEDQTIVIPDEINKNFSFSHQNDHLRYLEQHPHPQLGIPVFALTEKNKKEPHYLGLAKMPRIAYHQSTLNLVEAQHRGNNSPHYFDMAELMFGTLRDQGLSLKSRVWFGDAQLNGKGEVFDSGPVILNSPKPTFAAAYLEQQGREEQDYNNKNSRLSGWKRYIATENISQNIATNQKNNVTSKLELLKTGSEFTGELVFHNLKKEELGALLWVLQLGRTAENSDRVHGLGHGKPLGYGAVQLAVKTLQVIPNDRENNSELGCEELINAFIAHMDQQHPGADNQSWQNSSQLQHLLCMASLSANTERDLSYMQLGEYKGRNAPLPPLQWQGDILSRSEEITASPPVPTSFTRGRLANLITSKDKDDSWFTGMQKEKIEREQQEQQQIRKDELAALPEDERKIEQLRDTLEKAATDQQQHDESIKRIDDLVKQFLQQQSDKALVTRFLQLEESSRYRKITNKKVKERRHNITMLKQKYGIEDRC